MNTKIKQASQLRSLSELVSSKDARAPYADLTNAQFLMGDTDFGDSDYGDSDYGDSDYGDSDYGDADFSGIGDSDYGDVDGTPLAMMRYLTGDVEVGALSKRAKQGLGLAAGVAGGAVLGKMIQHSINKRRKRIASERNKLRKAGSKNTIDSQINARREMGKLPRNTRFRFFQANGAVLNAAQISPTESFVADMLKHNFDRQQSDTPFEVDIVAGTFAGVTWTVSALGLVTPRYYVAAMIRIGINNLTGNPGTIFNIVGIMPTINGNLTISTPFSFTIKYPYYAQFLIYPWQLVTNKPILALGQYSNANPITFNITGLPSTANVNMVVPGSLHTWTIGMRNSLL